MSRSGAGYGPRMIDGRSLRVTPITTHVVGPNSTKPICGAETGKRDGVIHMVTSPLLFDRFKGEGKCQDCAEWLHA